MYKPYGIHRKDWAVMKKLVQKEELKSDEIRKRFSLNDKQVWFLYDVLLKGKYNFLYKRPSIDLSKLKVGDYVYGKSLNDTIPDKGKGVVRKIDDEYIYVHFSSSSKDMLTLFPKNTLIANLYDNQAFKLTKLWFLAPFVLQRGKPLPLWRFFKYG